MASAGNGPLQPSHEAVFENWGPSEPFTEFTETGHGGAGWMISILVDGNAPLFDSWLFHPFIPIHTLQ